MSQNESILGTVNTGVNTERIFNQSFGGQNRHSVDGFRPSHCQDLPLSHNQEKGNIMNYYQLLAVLSIDGCLLDLTPESHWALMAALYSTPEYEELAKPEKTDKIPTSSQNEEWDDYPTIEANRNNISHISKLLREGKIRKMTMYTIPILAGNGYRLFSEISTQTPWRVTWPETTEKSNVTRVVYKSVGV